MKSVTQSLLSIMVLGFFVMGAALAGPDMQADVRALQNDWAVVKYRTSKDDQKAQFKELSERARTVSERYSGQAEPLIWEAIILSSYAGADGGFGALKAVRKARKLLLAAESIDPMAMDGSIYTTLGSLYYQVPGWPVSFGSDRKARQYLQKALRINPKGVDPNYFYGDFLITQGEYEGAIDVLKTALAAESRPDRPIADAGRREEVHKALARAQKQVAVK